MHYNQKCPLWCCASLCQALPLALNGENSCLVVANIARPCGDWLRWNVTPVHISPLTGCVSSNWRHGQVFKPLASFLLDYNFPAHLIAINQISLECRCVFVSTSTCLQSVMRRGIETALAKVCALAHARDTCRFTSSYQWTVGK